MKKWECGVRTPKPECISKLAEFFNVELSSFTSRLPKPSGDSLGDFIRKCRIENNLTQEGLAQVMNMSVNVLRAWEKNVRKPTGENLEKLVEFLGVDEGVLTDLEE